MLVLRLLQWFQKWPEGIKYLKAKGLEMESSNEHLFKVPIIKISQKSKLHATIKLKTGSSHCLTSRLPHEIQLQTRWRVCMARRTMVEARKWLCQQVLVVSERHHAEGGSLTCTGECEWNEDGQRSHTPSALGRTPSPVATILGKLLLFLFQGAPNVLEQRLCWHDKYCSLRKSLSKRSRKTQDWERVPPDREPRPLLPGSPEKKANRL